MIVKKSSRINDEKYHDDQDKKKYNNSANLPHIVSLQQFPQLCLNKI